MTQTTAPAMRLFDWGLLVLLSLLWGGAFVFMKIAVTALPPFVVVLCRVALAAATLALALRLSGQALPKGRTLWLAFAGMGLLNNLIPFSLIAFGQTRIGSGLASILNATTPVFSILIAHALTRDERMKPHTLAGVVLGFCGVAVLMGGAGLAPQDHPLLPMLACLGAALSYGFASVFGRRFRAMGVTPMASAFGQTAASSLLLLPVVLMLDAPWHLPLPSASVLGALVALAVPCTALAYILFFRVLAVGGAVNASLVTLLIPPSAILLGQTVLGERLSVQQAGGMALIALGLLAIDGRALARLRKRSH